MEHFRFNPMGVALVTPFNKDRSIDFEALKNLIDRQLNHVGFFVLLGSTSEAATLSYKEQWAIVEFALARINKQVPVVVGATSNNTDELVKSISNFNFEHIDGLLSAAPFYNKPSQKGIYEHFSAIANASPVPLILYNVPGRTSSNIKAETTLQLAKEYRNIVAVKEASGDFNQISRIIQNRPAGFQVFSGDDALTLPLMALGGDGVISVTANAYPQEFASMVNDATKGNLQPAREIYYKLLDMMDMLFKEGNPAGVKANLAAQGLLQNVLRLPLTPVSDTLYENIRARL